MIKIITDSASDLTKEYLLEHKEIELLQIPVYYNDKLINDFTMEEFCYLMESGITPKTSQINPNTYVDCFKKYKDYDILYISLSSELSGTYNSANIAKSILEDESDEYNITIYDSKTATLGQALLVDEAYELKEKYNINQIVEHLNNIRKKMVFRAVVDDLQYFVKGGRVTKAEGIIGNVLNIKPILDVSDNGKVYVYKKIRGLKKANQEILEELKNNKVIKAFVGCCRDNKYYQEFKNKINNIFSEFEIGPTVITYSGPVCYGIVYITD